MRTIPGERRYCTYQVLKGVNWYIIDLYIPLLLQTRGMRAYRMLDKNGNVIKQSSVRSIQNAGNY